MVSVDSRPHGGGLPWTGRQGRAVPILRIGRTPSAFRITRARQHTDAWGVGQFLPAKWISFRLPFRVVGFNMGLLMRKVHEAGALKGLAALSAALLAAMMRILRSIDLLSRSEKTDLLTAKSHHHSTPRAGIPLRDTSIPREPTASTDCWAISRDLP